jgi:phage terminase large subunit
MQGKDYICGRIPLWFLFSYAPSKVIITAPTDRQVKEVIWAELSTAWNNAKLEMPGRLLTCKVDVEPDWFILAFTTKESGDQTGKAQGFHSPNICVIVSEAQAVEDKIFEQLDSLLGGEHNLMIMIGNPLRTTGTFARAIDDTTNNIVIHLDALDSPNYLEKKILIPGMASYEWIEKRRKLWNPEGTEDDPRWLARVRGRKPFTSIDTLFTDDLIERMITQDPRVTVRKIVTSCDPARMGDDEQVIYGGISGRIVKQDIKPQCKSTESCSLILQMTKEIGANHIIIDCDGLGGPIADFVDDLKPDGITLQEVHSEGKPEDEQYDNLKAEMWFYAKQEAEAGRERIPDDEYLKQELQEMKYFINARGKIQIESKDDLKDRIGRSPDRADAWVMNVWGRKSSAVIHKKDAWRDSGDHHEVSAGAKSAMAS